MDATHNCTDCQFLDERMSLGSDRLQCKLRSTWWKSPASASHDPLCRRTRCHRVPTSCSIRRLVDQGVAMGMAMGVALGMEMDLGGLKPPCTCNLGRQERQRAACQCGASVVRASCHPLCFGVSLVHASCRGGGGRRELHRTCSPVRLRKSSPQQKGSSPQLPAHNSELDVSAAAAAAAAAWRNEEKPYFVCPAVGTTVCHRDAQHKQGRTRRVSTIQY